MYVCVSVFVPIYLSPSYDLTCLCLNNFIANSADITKLNMVKTPGLSTWGHCSLAALCLPGLARAADNGTDCDEK